MMHGGSTNEASYSTDVRAGSAYGTVCSEPAEPRDQNGLLKAQIAQDLLPAKVDMQAVNDLISQEAQTRADLQKSLVGAKVQVRQIMGDDNFRIYFRHIKARYWYHSGGGKRDFEKGSLPTEGSPKDDSQQKS
jgi:hypothetical protein